MRRFTRYLNTLGATSFSRVGGGATQGRTGVSPAQLEVLRKFDESLAEGESQARTELVKKIHAHFSARDTGEALSESEVALGVQRMERALLTSPLHIGFRCKEAFFNGSKAFFSTGIYESRWTRAGIDGKLPWKPRHWRLEQFLGREQPLYAALNVSLRGHKGWGNSCIVLRPHLLEHVRLNSNDSADEYIGDDHVSGSARHLLPIIERWARPHGDCRFYWKALAGENRNPIDWRDVDARQPVEAEIYTDGGCLRPGDIAMVCIDESELRESVGGKSANLEERQQALRRFEGETGIRVAIRPEKSRGESFLEQPGYAGIVAAYAARLESLESATTVTSRPTDSTAPSSAAHYTQVLQKHERPTPSSPSPSAVHRL